jgi:hypothetical protein
VIRWQVGAYPMGTLPGPPGTSLGSLNLKQPPHIPFGWGGGKKYMKKKVSTVLEENAHGVGIF